MIKRIAILICLFVAIASSAQNTTEPEEKFELGNIESNLNDLDSSELLDSPLQSELITNLQIENITDIETELSEDDIYFQKGIASFYGKRWNGRKTANGEIFDTSKLTAAHKTLPFGTKVRVINEENGKYIDVIINDRGPFIKGRIIDLTEEAFRSISELNKGITNVTLKILEEK